MKGFVCIALLLMSAVFLPRCMDARHVTRQHSHRGHRHSTTVPAGRGDRGVVLVKVKPNVVYAERRPTKQRTADSTFQIAGSRLPDCSHACGSCSPCRLVMVSFVCATLAEAETCPMAYKCMCNHKSYPVP